VRWWFLGLVFLLVLTALGVWLSSAWVERNAAGLLYSSVTDVPENRVGLVLGTSKNAPSGGPNLFFEARMDAAAELFRAGKVQNLIVSGDNSTAAYNEPADMRDALVARGVPENRIFLDYAGFRTLDSVIRARAIFGQERLTIISQAFHNERAVFIAQRRGIEAVGFNARDVGGAAGARVGFREVLARVQVVLDLYVLDTQPKFYGPPVNIP
jgi:SanA protein